MNDLPVSNPGVGNWRLEERRLPGSRKTRVGFLLMAASVIAASWGQIQLSGHNDVGWAGYLVAVVLAAIAARAGNSEPATFSFPPIDARFRTRWWSIIIAILCSILAYREQAKPFPDEKVVLAWWSLSLAFVLIPFFVSGTRMVLSKNDPVVGNDQPAETDDSGASGSRWNRRRWAEWGVVILLLGVALCFRLPGLERFPAAVHNDEASCGLMARQNLERREAGEDYWFRFCGDFYDFPAMGFFPSSVCQAVTRSSLYGHRLSNVILSIGSLACLFLLSRSLYGRVTALVTLALAATAHVAVHWSRSGIHSGHATWLTVICLFLAWTAISSGKARWFVLLGFSLAWCLLTYSAAYVIPVCLVMVAATFWVADTRFRRRYSLPVLLCGVSVLIFLSPMIAEYRKASVSIVQSKSERMIWSTDPKVMAHMEAFDGQHPRWKMLMRNFEQTKYLLQDSGDSNLQYGNRGIGIVDRFTAVLFIVGLGSLLGHPCRFKNWPLLLVLALTLLGGAILTTSGVQYSRIAGLAMILLIVPAIGVDQFLKSGTDAFGKAGARWICVGIVIGVIWIGYENHHYYFVRHDQYVRHVHPTLRADARRSVISHLAHDLGEGIVTFVHGRLPTDFDHQTYRFICGGNTLIAFESMRDLTLEKVESFEAAMILMPLEKVRRRPIPATGEYEVCGSAIAAEVISRFPEGFFIDTGTRYHLEENSIEAFWIPKEQFSQPR